MIRLRPRTVTLQLALLYVLLSSLVAGVVFVLVYLSLSADLLRRTDEKVLNMLKELRYIHQNSGLPGIRAEFKILEDTEGANRMFARVLAADLSVIASSDMKTWSGLKTTDQSFSRLEMETPSFRTMPVASRHHPVRVVSYKTLTGTVYQAGYYLRDNHEIMEKFSKVFSQAFIIMLVCGGILGWFLSRRAMQGVDRVRQAAVRIGAGDLNSRVPLGNEGQEIAGLALAFNEMIDKIRLLVKELQSVTDNIAHDLRSPITRMRGAAETTLSGEQSLPEYQEMAAMVVDECDRLVSMINTMLEIAMADAGAHELQSLPVDMCQVMQEAHELFDAVAEEKDLRLHLQCPGTPLIIKGERAKLQRALANLIDNAVKYTSPGGTVSLAAWQTGAEVFIAVSDTGPGIAPQDLARIFERFYRADSSRTTLGNGLGLSLAQAIIEAHGGRITVTSEPGKGTVFTVRLAQACADTV